MKDVNELMWEELHKEIRHQPKYPSEEVIRFVKRHFKEKAKILDDGCGAGRHVVYLAKEGYEPSGIDISNTGVKCTKLRLHEAGFDYDANIVAASCESLPFENDEFDGVISYGVFYYLHLEEIEKSVNEIYRVLKKGGKTLVILRSIEDYRFNPNTVNELKPHECVIDEKDETRSAFKENGMHMQFFDRDEVKKLFGKFKSVSVNSLKLYHNEDAYADVDFIVICEK